MGPSAWEGKNRTTAQTQVNDDDIAESDSHDESIVLVYIRCGV